MIERTLVLVKPDGVQRALVGEIIKRFENRGLKIVGLKLAQIKEDFAKKHYKTTDQQIVGMGEKTLKAASDAGNMEKVAAVFGTENPRKIGEQIYQWLIGFITSGPVVAIVLEGNNAIEICRKTCGYTDPAKAEVGTIRGDFGHTGIEVWNVNKSPVRNLVHASGTREEAETEIKLWFNKSELISYKKIDDLHVGLSNQ